MAPSSLTFEDRFLLARGDEATANPTVPVCVSTCMNNGPTTGCSGVTDYKCTCASSEYIDWVAECWEYGCSPEEAAFGLTYATQACAFYGQPINGTFGGGSNSPTGGPAISSPPLVTSPAWVNIQAIMSSICSFLLVVAIVTGIMSCRTRAKADQMASQNRTWNGVTGLTTMDSKAPKSSRFFTRTGHSSAFTNSRGATTTFQSDNYGVTSSNFGGTTLASPNHPSFASAGEDEKPDRASGVRFTNRLTLGELGNKSEEWEMADVRKDTDVSMNGHSPTSIGSKMESEVEYALQADGSTVHLNVLSKEQGKGDHHAL